MGLLVLTGCGPSESRTERSLERDVDEELFDDVRSSANVEHWELLSLSLTVAIVEDADPVEAGADLADLNRDHALTDVTIVAGDVYDSAAPSLTVGEGGGSRSVEPDSLTEDTWGDMVALFLEEEPASARLVTGDHGLAMNVQLGSSRTDAADLEAFRSWQSHETPAGLQNIDLSLEGQVLFYAEGGVITDVSEDEDSVTVLLSATAGESEKGLEALEQVAEAAAEGDLSGEVTFLDWSRDASGEQSVEVRVSEGEGEAQASALADLIEERLSGSYALVIMDSSGDEELAERGPDPDAD